MDALAGLLEGPRASGAFLLRVVLDPPWSIRVQDRSPLCLAAVLSGEAYVQPDHGEVVRLGPGDVAIVRGPDPYVLSDGSATPPQVIVHPGQQCLTPEGVELRERMALGVRTWGSNPDGSVQMLLGVYEEVGAVGQRLLDVLPPLLVVSDDSWDSMLIPILAGEVTRTGPAQGVVLDRLLDLLLISVLRVWFDRPDSEAPAWYRAQAHPIAGEALRLFHEDPAGDWTLARVAAEVGVSRATLAECFRNTVGTPPMTYLMEWRLALAADLLRQSDATLNAVARQVGYGSGFALSSAFKRVYGVSPQEHRAAAMAQ
ncbi:MULTISPECIES: AraC family transcriptional regulator [unclassified Micromonospora]|uniref:AraC family transcriptional regulator n=1 Tax=unclassified Micromonospora TaxID=2617518 RepID=UPI001051CD93|nr:MULTISPECIES: AraC family transcriptional regulator [unclassified Micromonospora]TDB80533.1 AraC family transcriptional regulator [Micromonospora sp. KC721]TDC43487.1 AraC family transcriptional regulator [Micromonospora sp. KC213]